MASGNGLPTPSWQSAGPQYVAPEIWGYGAIFAVQALAQGSCISQEYVFGTHAEATYNAEGAKTQIWQAHPAPPAPPPVVIRPAQVWTSQDDVLAQAEAYKTQIRGLFPGSLGQGFIVNWQVADEQEYFQPAPSFSTVYGAPPPIFQPILPYFAGPPNADFNIQPVITKSAPKAPAVLITGPTVNSYVAGLQLIDYTQQPFIQKSTQIPATIYALGLCFTVNIAIRSFTAPIATRAFKVNFFC